MGCREQRWQRPNESKAFPRRTGRRLGMWPLRPKYTYRPSAKKQCFQLDVMSCVNENKGLLRCCGCDWAPNMPGMFWSTHSTLTVPPRPRLAYASPSTLDKREGHRHSGVKTLVQEGSSADPRPLATHLLASTKLFPRPPPLAPWKKI